LIQIDFDNHHNLEIIRDFDPIQSGRILLDPNHYWCIHNCEINSKYITADCRIKVYNEIDSNMIKLPIPKRAITYDDQIRSTGEPLQIIWTIEYNLYQPSQPPSDDEFTLSAFGFPEPLNVRRPTP
jgi:hypothetical protein